MILPLHHGDGAGAGGSTNWLQRFNDSDAGVLVAGVLHSVGALLFAAGIALYLYIAHSLKRSAREGGPTHVGLLHYAHLSTLGGIALNAIGGLGRLYESDHPGLTRLGDSTWVQVLLVKHLFLSLGVGLALWLAWRTHVLTRRPDRLPRLHRESTRMTFYAVGSLATILVAAVLGAVAGNVDLAADLGTSSPALGTDDHGAHGDGAAVLADFATGGVITGSAAAPGSVSHQATVPEGTDRLVVVVRWGSGAAASLDQSRLDVVLKDPSGAVVEGEATRIQRSVTVVVNRTVATGLWTVTVTSAQAVNENYGLRVTALRSAGLGNVIERTVTVAPGRFFEANLLMEAGKTLRYEWSLLNTTEKIHFDIHRHPDAATVEYPVQGEWNRLDGSYTHAGPTQGPSLLWENQGSLARTVHLRATGAFSVHSYSG